MAIMLADHLNVTRCKISQFSSFEAMCCKITSSSFCAQVICLYRQPGNPTLFFEQFQDLLENMSSFPGELFILGNFNLPSNHTNTYTDLLTSFDLRQHVDFPTHIHGHWLDLFITRTACDLIKTVQPSDGLSDHMTMIADVDVKLISHPIKKCFLYRCVKGIPLTDFISDIKLSALISHPKLTCSELYQQYHTVLRSLLDKYASIKTKQITPKTPNTWMTMEIKLAERLRTNLAKDSIMPR